jgi:predicted ATPase
LGELAEARPHLDRALSLYDPNKHRPLATRFGQDLAVVALSNRSQTLWALGYPDAALSAYAQVGQFDDAWLCIGEAATKTMEKSSEAEVNRVTGEIALQCPGRDTAKAETYFDRALTVARKQQAKSLELRAAMSMARLWRDQGKRKQARELLAPVYGWFTEGFDTRDLKEAKGLLDE